MSMIDNLEALLAKGQDGAMLRLTLGNEYLKAGDARTAVEHLAKAVELDAQYSAAWKSYGRALTEAGDLGAAIDAFERGIEAAEARGDMQAGKEMQVFLKRARKRRAGG
ncbi:MAG: hypothetical protein GWO02_21385 [Gammaproteobacteria bacterium]|nr:hypothetical protein [Gammaproteobacteria bacterium]